LGTVAFWVLATVTVLLMLPGLVRALDRLLERPLEGRTDANGASSPDGMSLDEMLKPTKNTATYRSETEVLRAMKEALDAELASVRAQIERERKQAEAMEVGKEQS
jgi:hypothetical protein